MKLEYFFRIITQDQLNKIINVKYTEILGIFLKVKAMQELYFNKLMEKLDKIIDLLQNIENWCDEIGSKD